MNPVIEGTQTAPDRYEVTARPDNGKPVTLYVVPVGGPREAIVRRGLSFHREPRPPKYQVKRNPESIGLISEHRTFEAAAKSATLRAKRYVSLYGKKVTK